jgi:hypothetical protein
MQRLSLGLSRSRIRPSQLSLLTGETVYDPGNFSRSTIESEVSELIATDYPQVAHEQWLESNVAAVFNESVYHPYTSLKYHTVLWRPC